MIINLTPHKITVIANDKTYEIPPSGQVARVTAKAVVEQEVEGIPVVRTEFGEIQGLPEPQSDTVYLVSSIVAQAARRADVVAPDTGPTAIRENGQIVAVRGFQTF